MMSRRFDHILEDCLARMDRGESLLEILSVYPALTDQLKPLLLVAMLGRALPQPVPGYTALRQGKNQMLAEMASMQAKGSFLEPKTAQPAREKLMDRLVGSLTRLQPVYRFAMIAIVMIMTGGFFTLSASASGLAGDVMQTLFFSFEQVGDLLLIRPNPGKSWGDNYIFSNNYGLPDAGEDQAEDFKTLNVPKREEDRKFNSLVETAAVEDIQTRLYTFGDDPVEELEFATFVIGAEEEQAIDEKDLEKEEQAEDEKDLEKEEKEDEKDLEKEEKEIEKDLKEALKDAEKAEKEDQKEADKIEKEEAKDAAKEEKNK